MTRNSKKLNPEPHDKFEGKTEENEDSITSDPTADRPQNPGPFGISFVIPTEKVTIPSRGEYYPTNSPLHGVEELEIKHMTAREEDLLSSAGNNDDQNIFEKLIDGILMDKNIKASMLLEEDKMAILLSARTTGYGHEYKAQSFCVECNDSREYTFDLRKNSILDPDISESKYNPNTDTFSLTLPLTGVEVELLNYGRSHQEQIEADRKRKEKLNIQFNSTVAFLKKVIISANNIEDRSEISKLIDVLPAGDAKIIKSFFENCRPSLSTKQEVHCPTCNDPSLKEVPLSWAFFRTDI